MSKYLKKYNEETKEWEIVSAPDVSVIQQIEGGSDITDTNVIITNYHFIEESGTTTLDGALNTISDDISKLQRNVSWLAEHGGNGGGGGGSITSYGISVSQPIVTDKKAYVSSKKFTIEFMVTGGTGSEDCTYQYTYGTKTSPTINAKTNTLITIPIDNTGSTEKQYSITIRANINFIDISCITSFDIYESTLNIEFDKETASRTGRYDDKTGVFNILQNDNYAYIPILISNGLIQ